MKKLFGRINMGWPVVIVFAIIVGVYTAVMNIIPITEGTSFRDIAVSHEWWLIFAFVIVTNCEKNWEAALKVFVFFAISQPLIYGVEVLCGTLDAEMALYYLTTNWGIKTILTLPGGFLAFYITKQNPFGAIVLGLGCAIESIYGLYYFRTCMTEFPYHLLTAIVCFASFVIMPLCIQKENKMRIVTYGVAIFATAAVIAYAMSGGGFW